MSWTAPLGFALFLVGAALGLAQLWLRPWDSATFVKLLITIGVLLAVDVAWHLIVRERRDSERMRDKGKLE